MYKQIKGGEFAFLPRLKWYPANNFYETTPRGGTMKMHKCDFCKEEAFVYDLYYYDGGFNGRVNFELCNLCNNKVRTSIKKIRKQPPEESIQPTIL